MRKFAGQKLRARVDRDRIKQVFWNLCNNALARHARRWVLTVGLDASPDLGAHFAFATPAWGLIPRKRAKIFEPFQSGFVGGTGLGLAIVYQILQAHSGRIRVEIGKGKGAEFIVDLPRSKQENIRVAGSQLSRPRNCAPSRKGIAPRWLTLLIVDDERSICELLEISFRKEGHRVEVATSGEAASAVSLRRSSTSSFPTSACRTWMVSNFFAIRKEVSPATHLHSDHRCSHHRYRHRRHEFRRGSLCDQG